jgi:DNA polymerase-3 subunit gamma/tau
MLGLADRSRTIELFEKVVRGEAGGAIETFRSLFSFGADPTSVVLDLLQHCHGASVAKVIGPGALELPQDQVARLASLGAGVSAGGLARLWQMLLKAHAEVAEAPEPASAVEMVLIRLAYAADLPGPEEALRVLQAEAESSTPQHPFRGARSSAALAQLPAEPARSGPLLASPKTFEEVVRLIGERRDVALRLDVEKYFRLISFRMGAICFEPADGAPGSLAQRLASQLKAWTGQPWLVAAEGGGGAETLLERQKRVQEGARADVLTDPFVQSVMEAFPGSEIVDVRQVGLPAPAQGEDQAGLEE